MFMKPADSLLCYHFKIKLKCRNSRKEGERREGGRG